MMGLPDQERKMFDDIFRSMDTNQERDRRTDSLRQQTPRLRIASRGIKILRNQPTTITNQIKSAQRDANTARWLW